MMKIFENNKEPLFGRLTSKIALKPFTISVIKDILKDYNPAYSAEDLLFLYTLTGGVSHYVALLMNAKAVTFKKMLDFATRPDSPFLNEGKELLVSEFGRDYSTYFSILQLIAAGKISLQTLAMKTAAIQKQLAKYEVSLKALSLNDM